MLKLILSASLLLILKISSAQTGNDTNQLIIAPYRVCLKGVKDNDPGKYGLPITIQQLKDAGEVECSAAGFEIISFTFAMQAPMGPYREIWCKGALFGPVADTFIINRLKPGDFIFIDNVRAKNKTGKIYGLAPNVYRMISK
jgi:hypothetical protein